MSFQELQKYDELLSHMGTTRVIGKQIHEKDA